VQVVLDLDLIALLWVGYAAMFQNTTAYLCENHTLSCCWGWPSPAALQQSIFLLHSNLCSDEKGGGEPQPGPCPASWGQGRLKQAHSDLRAAKPLPQGMGVFPTAAFHLPFARLWSNTTGALSTLLYETCTASSVGTAPLEQWFCC